MLVDRNKLNMGNHEIMRERAKMEEVRFSNKDLQDKSHPWACFSNYFIREFIVQGIYYPTVEHYFSSQKFTTPEYKEEIRKARSGLKAKQLASVVRDDVVENWEEKQLDVMKRGVQAKFMQHIDLKNQLLATQHAEIFFVSSTGTIHCSIIFNAGGLNFFCRQFLGRWERRERGKSSWQNFS